MPIPDINVMSSPPMPDPLADLIEVLTRTRQLLLLPGNDFIWSSWDNAESAVREIDQFIQLLNDGKLPPRIKLSVLFAPTGPIQEVSISSGWGKKFIVLAEQFDRAAEKTYRQTSAK